MYFQYWDIEQQSSFEPLASGTKEFLKSYRKTLQRLSNVSMEERDYCLRKTIAWSIEDQLAVKKDLASRGLESITAIHEVYTVFMPFHVSTPLVMLNMRNFMLKSDLTQSLSSEPWLQNLDARVVPFFIQSNHHLRPGHLFNCSEQNGN